MEDKLDQTVQSGVERLMARIDLSMDSRLRGNDMIARLDGKFFNS
jgi:hypothetical protein